MSQAAGGSRGVIQLKELRSAAVALKLKVEEIETQRDTNSLESAFQTAKQKQVGAIMTTGTPFFFSERKWLVELAGKFRLPAIYHQKEFVDEGGLMSYGVDFNDLYRLAAVYVDKILKGAKPADLPVQQATKFEFIINLKAAEQIGLTIPNRVLERANQGDQVKRDRQSALSKPKTWVFVFVTPTIKLNLDFFVDATNHLK